MNVTATIRRTLALLVAGVLVGCAPPPAPPAGPTPPSPPSPPTTSPGSPSCPIAPSAAGTGSSGWDPPSLEGPSAAWQSLAAATAAGPADPVTVVLEEDGRPTFEVTTPSAVGQVVADAVADPDRDVVAVEPTGRVSVMSGGTASDPLRGSQWALSELNMEAAWACGTGSGVSVAVVDTGVDASHPEFAGRITPGVAFLGAGTAQPGAGGADPNGHGTHVAGIIGAGANNGIGVTGVAPGSRIIPVRVLDETGTGFDVDVANGIVWAVESGARVINLSLGGVSRSMAIAEAISFALSAGAVVVAAAGNYGPGSPVVWPAAEPGVIAVGASMPTKTIAPFSSQGPFVSLAAPGGSILSTLSGGGYGPMSGTSMAAPHVAGVAALVVGSQPQLSPATVRQRIVATAIDQPPAGVDPAWGAGLLNPAGAIFGG